MIKVGDKLYHQGKEWNVEFAGEPFVHLKNGDDFIIESSHIFWNKLYVEQKQRADELEDVIKRYHDEALREIKRADELENTLAYIKSHLNNLWHNGDATEHEYAYNTLKYIESLQENNNA